MNELTRRYRAFVAAFEGHSRERAPESRRPGRVPRANPPGARLSPVPVLDPGLPDELVPTQGYRARAVDLFHDLYGSLGEAAQRYFDAATAVPLPVGRRAHRDGRERARRASMA